MNKTSIEWCDFTWNPVTGCKRGCWFCYAKRIHDRFEDTPFSDIEYFPNRLDDPGKVKKPSKIFVGSMSDIAYWPWNAIEDVMKVCDENRQHTFMFLTKDIDSYLRIKWPPNTMQGMTVYDGPSYRKIGFMQQFPRSFLSIEPIMAKVMHFDYSFFELVIVGAMTGPGAIKPKPEWIESVKRDIPKDKLFLKDSIKPYMQEDVEKWLEWLR